MSFLSWLASLFRPRPAPAPAPPPDPSPVVWRAECLRLVNGARVTARVLALVADAGLDAAAQVQANRMASAGRLFHGPTDEVIGMGQRSPDEIVSDWLASPRHRARLLDHAYTRAGFGRAESRAGVLFWVGDFA